jgi:hypothetical protein
VDLATTDSGVDNKQTMTAFFQGLGVYPVGFDGGQTRAASVRELPLSDLGRMKPGARALVDLTTTDLGTDVCPFPGFGGVPRRFR